MLHDLSLRAFAQLKNMKLQKQVRMQKQLI
jgi:hypothetical protein